MADRATERVTGRVANAAEAREAFLTLADAEQANIPTYARICRIAAANPEVHALLLEAPVGQRLPVLVLAAIHDVVLRHGGPLVPWYPSVSGAEPSAEDPHAALLDTVRTHRDEIVDLVRHRQTQTNEVNRSCAWWWGAAALTRTDDRPLAVIELGASAGLNLAFDRYAYRFDAGQRAVDCGPADAPVRLAAEVRGDLPDGLEGPLPPVLARVGLDQRPLDPTDADDRRWLQACTWPEQRTRGDRLRAALDHAATDPPRVVRGDVVDDVAAVVAAAPSGAHVLVLSSWVLAYIPRERRDELAQVLTAAAGRAAERGGRVSLLTLEAAHVLPWMDPPPLDERATAERRHASILACTSFGTGEPVAVALLRAQAHVLWCEPLSGVDALPSR